MRRKDSITLAKIRMLRQQGEGGATSHNEQGAEKEAANEESSSAEKKHPIFRPPTFINIVSEQAEEASCSDVADLGEHTAAVKATFAHPVKPSASGKAQVATASDAQIDSDVTSTGKERVSTFTKEITMNKGTEKKALSEVTTDAAGQHPSTHIVPHEDLAAAMAAMAIDDVDDNACMDNRSEQPL